MRPFEGPPEPGPWFWVTMLIVSVLGFLFVWVYMKP